MRILFVSAVFPYPLYSGGQVRIYNLLKKLSLNHEIHLVAFIRNEHERTHLNELSFCRSVHTVYRGKAWQPHYLFRSVFGVNSFLHTTYDNSEMKALLGSLLAGTDFDLIHLEPGYVGLSLPETEIPVVISEHNIEHDVYAKYAAQTRAGAIRPVLLRDIEKMKMNERKIWKKAAEITAVSEEDAHGISELSGKKHIHIVQNGVDVAYFVFKPKPDIPDPPSFLYVGTFTWMQNVDAVLHALRDIWPAIIRSFPGATLRIIGSKPPESLTRYAGNSVRFLQTVADIRTEYYRADVLFAPIRVGGGTKYKIIESMACGLPVLTTTVGAAGFPAKKSQEMWIADSAPEFVLAVHDIMKTQKRSAVLANARRRVEKEYSWDSVALSLENVWKHAYEFKKN